MNEEYEIKIENYGYINIYSVIRNIKIPDCLLGKIEANDFLMEEWKKNYEIIRKKYPVIIFTHNICQFKIIHKK